MCLCPSLQKGASEDRIVRQRMHQSCSRACRPLDAKKQSQHLGTASLGFDHQDIAKKRFVFSCPITVGSPQIGHPPDPGKLVALRSCPESKPHAIRVAARPSPRNIPSL
jgi:hypothetical protein